MLFDDIPTLRRRANRIAETGMVKGRLSSHPEPAALALGLDGRLYLMPVDAFEHRRAFLVLADNDAEGFEQGFGGEYLLGRAESHDLACEQ
jgi:hypothetical protein